MAVALSNVFDFLPKPNTRTELHWVIANLGSRVQFMKYIQNDSQLTIVFFHDPRQDDALLLLPRYDE